MSRILKLVLPAVLVGVMAVAALGGAQPAQSTTAAAAQTVPDQLLGFLSKESPAILAATLAGLIFKFFPVFRNITNEWIPVLAAATAWIVRVLAPDLAHASFLGDLGATIAPTALSFVDAILAKVFHDLFLKGPTSTHWTKPVPDSLK